MVSFLNSCFAAGALSETAAAVSPPLVISNIGFFLTQYLRCSLMFNGCCSVGSWQVQQFLYRRFVAEEHTNSVCIQNAYGTPLQQ